MLQKFGKLHRKQAAWDVNAEIKGLILALSLFLDIVKPKVLRCLAKLGFARKKSLGKKSFLLCKKLNCFSWKKIICLPYLRT
jgi:hypothetical protein